jgi:AcrR family transcriptional regulator/predicted transcriptional regulator
MSAPANAGAPAARVVSREGARVIEMQRRRLLLAMQELAGEHGLAEATVGKVCKRSRVSRRTFYELFADRDACFLAAFELALAEIAEIVLPAYRRPGDWRERIRAGLQALLLCFDEHPRLARLCIVETPKGDTAVLARRREILALAATAIDGGREHAHAASGPPQLTAESTVGGVLAVIHARLLDPGADPLTKLTPSLAAMIVLPYLGPAASRRELGRPATLQRPNHSTRTDEQPHTTTADTSIDADPFRDLPIRFTYRTARVLAAIAQEPGVSNRHVSEVAGAPDQGQVSKLLKRLTHAGLIENDGAGPRSGEPNAWRLTPRGQVIHNTLGPGTR